MKEINTALSNDFFKINYVKNSKVLKGNMIQILENIGSGFVPLRYGVDRDFNYHIKTKNGGYVLTESSAYSDNINFMKNKHPVKIDAHNSEIEKIRMGLDYHTAMLYSSLFGLDSRKIFHHYASFFAYYLNFKIYFHAFEEVLNKQKTDENLRPLTPSYYYRVLTDGFLQPRIEKWGFNFNIEKIIKRRKIALKEDPRRYYFFRLYDTFSYYPESYYFLCKLVDEFIRTNPIGKDRFISIIKRTKFEPFETDDFLLNFLHYDNSSYFNLKNKDEKLSYYTSIGNFCGKRYFTEDFLINEYPHYPLSILKIQDELGIKK